MSKSSSSVVPTRAARLHNKSAVPVGNAVSSLFSVNVYHTQPEKFACVILAEDENSFTVRRKKGSGSSKVIEVIIPRKDVIEVAGRKGEQCIMSAITQVNILKLTKQSISYDKFGMLVCTSAETGEVTRVAQNNPLVVVHTLGEEGEKKAAVRKPAASKVPSRVPARRTRAA